MHTLAKIAGIIEDIQERSKHGFTVVMFTFTDFDESLWRILRKYVDVIKFCGCVSFFVDDDVFNSKVEFFKSIGCSLGFDLSYIREKINMIGLAKYLHSLGFEYIEFNVSPGKERYDDEISLLEALKKIGMRVIVKISKPYKERKIDSRDIINIACTFLDNGAKMLSLEGGLMGRDTLIYDNKGNILWDRIIDIVNNVPLEKILFEAPLWKQQAELIAEFGPNIGISNVEPRGVLYLESLRYGFSTGYFPESAKMELTPSAKFVYYVLKKLGPMDAPQIAYTTGLPGRTVREALRLLSEKGLILEVKRVGKRRIWKTV